MIDKSSNRQTAFSFMAVRFSTALSLNGISSFSLERDRLRHTMAL